MSFTAHEGLIMATISCHCQIGNAPMIIRGTDLISMCRTCGAQYAILKVSFDRGSGDRAPQVGVTCVKAGRSLTPVLVQ